MSWLLVALCLFVAFVFSGIEAGILSVSRVRLKHRARLRDAAALTLERLLAQPERLLVTVLVVTNLANVFAVTLAVREAVALLGNIGYVVTLGAFLPIHLFGVELLPKSLFRHFPYRALALLAQPLWLADVLLTPMHLLGRAVSRLFGRAAESPQKLFVAREDFKYLTIETERAGSLTPVERKMIHGVVDFRSVTARDVMVPIEQAKVIAAQADLSTLIARARETGLDRWPVRNESGAFTGIVSLLDVALSGRRTGPAESVQRRIVKLSPNDPAFTVLQKLRAARSTMAAVLDADGTPIGLVAWEDVILRLMKSAVS
ncbi:MAG: CNNM domain-containing protein [Chthoniobacteraceae bacterium]